MISVCDHTRVYACMPACPIPWGDVTVTRVTFVWVGVWQGDPSSLSPRRMTWAGGGTSSRSAQVYRQYAHIYRHVYICMCLSGGGAKGGRL